MTAFENFSAVADSDPPYYSLAIGDEAIEVHFPNRFMEPLTPSDISLARRALEHVRHMDNQVQDLCEKDSRSLDITQFLFRIAYFSVREDQVSITYWGTEVNTEWDAIFERGADGSWSLLHG
ncbi:hypothetical protein [Posidoniimonas corsicana]|uniref:hypothetical protein n=1 Tax=Posidoniimonas corsicana TaxID=1938618 RepID=UPI0011B785AE|nr:hypothetical protein [Posidoniimonas corsicana]